MRDLHRCVILVTGGPPNVVPDCAVVLGREGTMMRWRLAFLVALVALVLVLAPDVALAGPGGKIAAAVAKSFWGRVVLVALVIVFLPLIVYVLVRERIGERRAHAALRELRAVQPTFDWLTLKDRVTECFHRVHSAWRREDM